jgi:hypothetical protein
MDSGASFFIMLAAMLVVMAIGFLKLVGIGPITLLFWVTLLLQVAISIFHKLASKKVNIIKQQDVIVGIEPIGKNIFIARFYSHLYVINGLVTGVFSGCLLILLSKAVV